MADKKLTPAEIAANKRVLQHVKAWLRYRGYSQTRLAAALGMSEPTISKWFAGKQSVTVAQFAEIAAVLDAEPSDLMGSPPDAERTRRYRKIAEVARDVPEEALEEWLAIGRRLRRAP